MVAPAGWSEPAQTPGFDEYTIVLRGVVRVESDEGVVDVAAGEAIVTRRGERVLVLHPQRGGRVHRHLSAGVLSGGGESRRLSAQALMFGARTTDTSGMRPFDDACGDTAQVFASERILF